MVFERQGCPRCHTRFDAPPASGPFRLPAPQDRGLLASRTGPDLGLEGHRRSDDWQLAHLYAPAVVVPGTPMPAFRQLFRNAPGGTPVPDEDALRLVAYLQSLGRGRRDLWAEFRSREPEVPAPGAVPDAERLARGKALYSRHCEACHGVDGDGRGPAAPLLARPPRDFVAAAYRFRSNDPWDPPRDRDLYRLLTIGTGTGAAMPAFYFLAPADRWALVRRIREFSPGLRGAWPEAGRAGEGGPAAGPRTRGPERAGRAEAGRALWRELGCARCHGADAAGRTAAQAGAVWTDAGGTPIRRSSDLRHACARRGGGSVEAFRRALLHGVGAAMPSYGDALAGRPGAAADLLAYVERLGAAPAPDATSPGR